MRCGVQKIFKSQALVFQIKYMCHNDLGNSMMLSKIIYNLENLEKQNIYVLEIMINYIFQVFFFFFLSVKTNFWKACEVGCFIFLLGSFCLFMEVPGLRFELELQCQPPPQPQQRRSWAAAITYAAACSNARSFLFYFILLFYCYFPNTFFPPLYCMGTQLHIHVHVYILFSPFVMARSLTHWMRPGIEPTSPWVLVGFLPCWATTGTPACEFYSHKSSSMHKWTQDTSVRKGRPA